MRSLCLLTRWCLYYLQKCVIHTYTEHAVPKTITHYTLDIRVFAINDTVFCNMTLCSLLKIYIHLNGSCCFRLQVKL